MKRGNKELNQAACCDSGMRTIVSLKGAEPQIHTHANVRAVIMETLSRKGSF